MAGKVSMSRQQYFQISVNSCCENVSSYHRSQLNCHSNHNVSTVVYLFFAFASAYSWLTLFRHSPQENYLKMVKGKIKVRTNFQFHLKKISFSISLSHRETDPQEVRAQRAAYFQPWGAFIASGEYWADRKHSGALPRAENSSPAIEPDLENW